MEFHGKLPILPKAVHFVVYVAAVNSQKWAVARNPVGLLLHWCTNPRLRQETSMPLDQLCDTSRPIPSKKSPCTINTQ